MKQIDTISLAAQVGGEDAHSVMSPFYMPLRKSLSEYCKGPYSSKIEKFMYVLRIDGIMATYDFEGCEFIELSAKKKIVHVDIGIPKKVWNRDGDAIKRFLISNIKDGFELMVSEIKKEKFDLEEDSLRSDFNRAVDAYLENS